MAFGQSVSALGAGPGLSFVPVTPCRIADTRTLPAGPFSGPAIANNETRSFPIPQSACGIPSTAVAYSLNVTVAPNGPLDFVTVWPTGLTRPMISLMNSYDGRVKANAAIVAAGTSGSIDVFASTPISTGLIIDIDGYFVPSTSSSLAFYPITPCRLVDTDPAPLLDRWPDLSCRQADPLVSAPVRHVQYPFECAGLLVERYGDATQRGKPRLPGVISHRAETTWYVYFECTRWNDHERRHCSREDGRSRLSVY